MRRLDALSPDARRQFELRFTSLLWRPNMAQDRLFGPWRVAPYPRVHVVTFGNRTGKTEGLGEFLCGAVKGNDHVNPGYCQTSFFDDLAMKRQKNELTIWWVAAGELMKQGGPDYKIINRHIPDAVFKARTNNGIFREIHIPVVGERGDITIVVSVKTHDQDTLAFAGENVDLVICDEPPPQEHWAEISARMVNLAGEEGGRILIGGTPLKIAGYLLDVIESAEGDDGRVVHSCGSIWENCHGAELPDEMAKAYDVPWDDEAQMWDTRGHLSADGIANAIDNWKKSGDPDEMTARVDGTFTHIAGRIYKIFSEDAHVVADYAIPAHYPIVQIIDPHDTRPDASGWFAITPRNRAVCIAEYPKFDYELITSRAETIPMTCDSWRKIEAELGIEGQVVARFGDPNKLLDPDPNTGKTAQQLYKDNGFTFNVNVTDKLDYGHEKTRQFLYYDRAQWEQFPDEPMNQPRLTIFRSCRNHRTYMRKYGTKVNKDPSKAISEIVDQKWKDFADLVRYFCVTFRPYDYYRSQLTGRGDNEWEKIKAARSPSGRLHTPQVFASAGSVSKSGFSAMAPSRN